MTDIPVPAGERQSRPEQPISRQESNRIASEFVSLVSHELRTPLTSIKGYVDLLLDGEVGPLSEEQQQFLQIVKQSTDRLFALINNLHDLSRLEAGTIQLKRAPVHLRRLIDGVVEELRARIRDAGLQLTVALPDNLPAAEGDAVRLAQVLRNLLSNAVNYTPAGGSIRIAAQVENDRLHVDVQDSGVGIAPEDQPRLFMKFFRAANYATQEEPGTGLGLVIARSLVEMHGGTIGVESTPGIGTTFSFTLPISHDEPGAHAAESRAHD